MAGLQGGEIRIGGFEYQYSLLPVGIGHPLRWELIALLGESVLRSLAQAAVAGTLGDSKVESLLGGLAGVLERLDPKFVLRLQTALLAVTTYREPGGNWTPLAQTFEVHFAGRYHELDLLTWAQLRANYFSFLDDSEVWKAAVNVGKQALSAVQSRATSSKIGTSGESSVASTSA